MATIMSSAKVNRFAEYNQSFDTDEQLITSSGDKIIGATISVDVENHISINSKEANKCFEQESMSDTEYEGSLRMFGLITYPELKY